MRYRGIELHSHEEVRGVFRQYPARMIIQVLLAANLIAYSFLFFFPLWHLRVFGWDIHIVGRVIFFLAVGIGLAWGLRTYFIYRGTMLIVTTQRVVKVERLGLFDKVVSEIPYESLSDISYRSKGIFETMIGAGTISFQMLGGKGEYMFKHLMDPAGLQKLVMELRVAFSRGTTSAEDPMEDVMNKVSTLNPVERRALLTTLKKGAARRRSGAPPETDATA